MTTMQLILFDYIESLLLLLLRLSSLPSMMSHDELRGKENARSSN
jgi:hypothetical protein